jgi:hypothetical protein
MPSSSEMHRQAVGNVADGTWIRNRSTSKTAILKLFGEVMGFKNLPDKKTAEIQK